MSDSKSKKVQLSAEGETRRHEMLLRLQLEMKSARDRRARFRSGAVVVGCLALLLFSLRFFGAGADPSALPIVDNGGATEPKGVVDKVELKIIDLVQNREDVTQKYVVSLERPSRVKLDIIDDVQLAQQLNEIGQPSVVGRINGEFRIVSLE